MPTTPTHKEGFKLKWAELKRKIFTLNCLFSSRNLWTSTWSLLYSSITFLTSVSSKEELIDLDITEDSVFAVVDIILFISTSCCQKKDSDLRVIIKKRKNHTLYWEDY